MKKYLISLGLVWAGALSGQAAIADSPAGALTPLPVPRFENTGPAVIANVARRGYPKSVPLARLPYVQDGDTLELSFPFAKNTPVRYHAVIAEVRKGMPAVVQSVENLYELDPATPVLMHILAGATPLIVIFPENGNRGDRGVSAMRSKVVNDSQAFLDGAVDLLDARNDAQDDSAFLNAIRVGLHSNVYDARKNLQSLAAKLNVTLDPSCFAITSQLEKTDCLIRSASAQFKPSSVLGRIDVSEAAGSYLTSHLKVIAPSATPYISVILDLYNLLSAMRVGAQYEFDPAILKTDGGDSFLALSKPWSGSANPGQAIFFAAGPPVATVPARPVAKLRSKDALCLSRDDVALPATLEGDIKNVQQWAARVTDSAGEQFEVPVTASALGFDIDTSALLSDHPLLQTASVSIHGTYGFDDVQVPPITAAIPHSTAWVVSPATTGNHSALHIVAPQNSSAACIDTIMVDDGQGHHSVSNAVRLTTDGAEVSMDLSAVHYGNATVHILQKDGIADNVSVVLDPPPPANATAMLFVGDLRASVSGTGLDAVRGLQFGGLTFNLGRALSPDASTVEFSSTSALSDIVSGSGTLLLSGTATEPISVTVHPAHPQIANAEFFSMGADDVFRLAGTGLYAPSNKIDVKLTAMPSRKFPAANAAVRVRRIGDDGNGEVMQSAVLTPGTVIEASIVPAQAATTELFGALEARIDDGSGKTSWTDLGAAVVRLPRFIHAFCSAGNTKCQLTGQDLFLIKGVSRSFDESPHPPVFCQRPPACVQAEMSTDKTFIFELYDAPGKLVEAKIP